jgi:small subunit ribosomal protein S23
MGRINLSALRVRKRALQKHHSISPKASPPIWTDIMSLIPPAQILTRKQPTHHPTPEIRTRNLSNARIALTRTTPSKKTQLTQRQALYKPLPLEYSEDALRQNFYTDHPWELARPRVILETVGPTASQTHTAYTSIQPPGVPLSGENVIQRQLHLLHTTDLTLNESYDVARKEFYALRRREATRRRIGAEEARMMGATWHGDDVTRTMGIEDAMYEDWAKWADGELLATDARNAAFAGQQSVGEKKAVDERTGLPPSRAAAGTGSANGRVGAPIAGGSAMLGDAQIGHDVFAGEAERKRRQGMSWRG